MDSEEIEKEVEALAEVAEMEIEEMAAKIRRAGSDWDDK